MCNSPFILALAAFISIKGNMLNAALMLTVKMASYKLNR